AARIQSRTNHPHTSAFWELWTFAILAQAGFAIEVEPPAGRYALDYLTHLDAVSFYVECTAIGQDAALAGSARLQDDLLEAINNTPTGGFLLSLEVISRGRGAPSVKRLRRNLGNWLQTLNASTLTAAAQLDWSDDGWNIVFTAIPA